ncbi:hypothetical protein D5F01_LYC25260 [Larimichthys crocea]|uniref:Uncharacterized protein n=1 Tax=Larimichthys crocea TaxID=215358 RepID=A0A6G0HDA0_LARCR|nr:hypothetical protein D5F01_LYC25260 [Larimichthys crocea]
MPALLGSLPRGVNPPSLPSMPRGVTIPSLPRGMSLPRAVAMSTVSQAPRRLLQDCCSVLDHQTPGGALLSAETTSSEGPAHHTFLDWSDRFDRQLEGGAKETGGGVHRSASFTRVSLQECERLHEEVQLLLSELQRGDHQRREEERMEALLAHTHTQLELLRDAESFLSPQVRSPHVPRCPQRRAAGEPAALVEDAGRDGLRWRV